MSARRLTSIAANSVTVDCLFTVNLTRGAYVVRSADSEKLLAAIEARAPHVLVDADLLGDGLYYSPVRIVVAHVISIVQNECLINQGFQKPRLSLVHTD